MKNVEKHIDEIVSRVLSEAINSKADEIMEKAKKPKPKTSSGFEHGEIVSGDIEEYSFGDTTNDDNLGYNSMLPSSEYEKQMKKPHKVKNVGDKYERKISKEFNEENILKKMFGKKEDPEATREKNRQENPYLGNLGYEYDDIRGYYIPEPGQGRFDNRDDVVKSYKEKNTQTNSKSEDGEMEEGNAFSGALAKAKKDGDDSFEVDGKSYPVKESIRLSESELIDLIEKIVKEQTAVPVTNKSLKATKTENDDNTKEVIKKMQTYLKDGSKGKYEMNPTQFPKGNGELAKMTKKAYTPSSAVEEYIENFAYSPGMENLQYDEIKPNEDWLKANIEGSSKTGNGAGGNAIDTGLGKKINARRKKNLYGAEKNRSYNRVAQPIDQAGEETHNKTLDNIFKQIGESEDKNIRLVNEEMNKMKHLLGYKKKTQ